MSFRAKTQRTGHRASDCFKKKRDQGGEQANAAKGKTAENKEVAPDMVLTVIDKEEFNYLMCEPCTEVEVAETINYTEYTNAKNIECLTCKE
jgi:hypothetical protein